MRSLRLPLVRLLSIVLIIAAIVNINSCQMDDLEEEVNRARQGQHQLDIPTVTGAYTNIHRILQDPVLGDKMENLIDRQSTTLENGGLTTDSDGQGTLAGIVIDTTYIKKYFTDSYENYTFRIVQDSAELQTVLRNYMLTVFNDTLVLQHLVEHPRNPDGTLDKFGIRMQKVIGNELLQQLTTESGCPPHYAYDYHEECSITPCKNGHTTQGSCAYADDSYTGTESPPIESCIGSWVRILISIGCPDLRDPNGSNRGSASSNNNPPRSGTSSGAVGSTGGLPAHTDDDGAILEPVESGESTAIGIQGNDPLKTIDPEKEKALDVLRQEEEPNLKAALEILRENSTLNKRYETGYKQLDNKLVSQLPRSGANRLVFGSAANVLGYAHCHPNDYALNQFTNAVKKSFQCFSPGDLHTFISILKKRKADGKSLRDAYGKVVFESGTMTVKFVGEDDEIPDTNTILLNIELNKAELLELIDKKGFRVGFMKFIQSLNIPNMDKLEFYLTDSSGEVQKIEFDNNGNLKNNPIWTLD